MYSQEKKNTFDDSFFFLSILLLGFIPQLLFQRSLLFCHCQLAGIHSYSLGSL